ncbi:MAG: helix-turn-helix domain-containing protein, partial [Solirubrobacteraceae bacterium]
MPIPIAVAIELSDEERALLEGFVRRRTSAHGLAQRSRIVLWLAAAEGLTNGEIAGLIGVSRPTVTKWRRRFADRRIDGLTDEPRPGRPRT